MSCKTGIKTNCILFHPFIALTWMCHISRICFYFCHKNRGIPAE